ncbi:MAG: response regulator [Burkholderiaceae bacterium]|jgi:FixJ family two-component response regulator
MPQIPYAIPVPPVVYVVDDDEAIRELVVEIARSLNSVARSYARATDFLESYRAEPIECLVVDIRMPEMSGLEVQKALLDRGLAIPMIFITGYGDVGTAVEAMRAGALDYIQKPFSPEDLATKIKAGLERSKARHLASLEQGTIDARFSLLTAKEREVALRVVAGKSSREIADEFGLSVRTIENHRARIMDKLHADSVVELVHLLTTRVNGPER